MLLLEDIDLDGCPDTLSGRRKRWKSDIRPCKRKLACAVQRRSMHVHLSGKKGNLVSVCNPRYLMMLEELVAIMSPGPSVARRHSQAP